MRRTTIYTTAAIAAGIILTASPAQAQAVPPVPTFGAFANIGGATDGGFGKFEATRSLSANTPTTGRVGLAQANLATGTLHASSLARRDCPNGGCGGSFGVNSIAALRDRYVFTNTGENIALIPVSLRIDGICAGNGAKSARYRFAFSSGPIFGDAVPYRDLPCSGSVDIVAPIGLVSFVGDTSYFAFVEITTLARMPDGVSGFALADFGHTLKVDIVLPPGITARSASGVFPFRAPVPEPEVWALMIGGFGLTGAAMRRRHASQAVVSA
jgi:hypothetical protein